jgi:GT2 family glycosyltransferase
MTTESMITNEGRAVLNPERKPAGGRIGIVTVLFNSSSVLPGFFASLEIQSCRNFTVYCIDNASLDGSADLCERQGSLYKVIRNSENVGVAKANNQGIQAALGSGCDYVLLLNNDVEFGSGLLEEMLAGMEAHQADMVTPLIYYYEPKDRIWCAGGKFSLLYGNRGDHYGLDQIDRGQFSEDVKVDYTPTCCVLIRSGLFDRVGFMDEHYFVYGDDSDWMLRARKHGASLWYLAGPKLWHKVSSLTGGKVSEFSTRYGRRSNAYYHFKHLPWVIAMSFAIVYCTYFLAGMLIPQQRQRARLSLKSWVEGIRLYRQTQCYRAD